MRSSTLRTVVVRVLPVGEPGRRRVTEGGAPHALGDRGTTRKFSPKKIAERLPELSLLTG